MPKPPRFRGLLRVSSIVLLPVIAAGCLSTPPQENFFEVTVDLSGDPEGWTASFADVSVAQEADVGFVAEHRTLPPPLDGSRGALYLRGDNVSDDLFMFWKIFASGFPPGVYTVSLEAEFASNIHAGCTVGNGVSVWIKAGLTTNEPLRIIEADTYRMNIDKGEQISGGQFVNLGDIRNTLTGCPPTGTFGLRTLPLTRQPTTLQIGLDGSFWLFIATESGFQGPHEIYITRIVMRLE